MGVHNIGQESEFNTKVYESSTGKLAVLDCFATWCGPCKAIAPVLAKLSDTYTDVEFYKIDVDELAGLAQSLKIRAMPTFLFFKDGKKVDELVGADPKALEAKIQSNK